MKKFGFWTFIIIPNFTVNRDNFFLLYFSVSRKVNRRLFPYDIDWVTSQNWFLGNNME